MKHYHPTTPSRRHMTTLAFRDVLSSVKPYKALLYGRMRAKGRSRGRITVRHRGGGSKKLYREIDFQYGKKDIPGRIETIEYDPYRSGFIARVLYADGERRYILMPEGLRVGHTILASKKAEVALGNSMPLGLIPVGTSVYNIETYPASGARLVRAAGALGEVIAHDTRYTLVKIPSGTIRKIDSRAWATIGQVSNPEHNQTVGGKAGRTRWKGFRPSVRGSAMNPVDHPYGGGEGRALRGTRRPKNKWGRGTRGVKTRKRKKYSNALIVQGRKK